MLESLVDHPAVGNAPRALVLGSGDWTVSLGLAGRGTAIDVVYGDWPSIQLDRRYALAVIEPRQPLPADPGHFAAAVHCAVQHLEPGGCVVACLGADDPLASRFELEELASVAPEGVRVAVLRRSDRRTIHDVVFDARSRLVRVGADELAARLAGPRPPIVVDTRTPTDRERFGVIAGSIHVPRTVVEWHLDPANGYRHHVIESFEQPLVLVCNGGYSSSLAAAGLLDLGFSDVGDLIGGIRAWSAAGYDVVEPDHSHLDV